MMSEKKGLVSGTIGARKFEHPCGTVDVAPQHWAVWNIQLTFECFSYVYATLLAAFGATEEGAFNAFSFFSMEVMVYAAASLFSVAFIWTFVTALINLCGQRDRPRCPPVHRSAAGWFCLLAGWWALGVYFNFNYNNRTGLFTPHDQYVWQVTLNWPLIAVALATTYTYWTCVLKFVALYTLEKCGADNPHLKMLI